MTGIRAYFANLVDAIAEGRRRRGCLLTNSLIEMGERDPAVWKGNVESGEARNGLCNCADRASADGEIGPEPGAKGANFLVCIVQGLNVLANTRPDRQTLEQIVASALRAL